MMVNPALLLACRGCCCGHPARGGAKLAARTYRHALRTSLAATGVGDDVRFAFTECLGPCSEANVLFAYVDGRPSWFRRINQADVIDAFFAYLRAILQDPAARLPSALARHTFRWIGGGVGPLPPVEIET